MALTSFANLVSSLYRQIGPQSSGYQCKGYAEDSRFLESVNKQIESITNGGGTPSRDLYLFREDVQKCLSDVGNVLTGSSGNDPSLGMYLGIAGGVAVGIAGLAFYMKSKKNGKAKQ